MSSDVDVKITLAAIFKLSVNYIQIIIGQFSLML